MPVAALSATLVSGRPGRPAGTAVPPLWHWLYFRPCPRQRIGPDGAIRSAAVSAAPAAAAAHGAGGRACPGSQPTAVRGPAGAAPLHHRSVSRTRPAVPASCCSCWCGTALSNAHGLARQRSTTSSIAVRPSRAGPRPRRKDRRWPARPPGRAPSCPMTCCCFLLGLTFNGHRIHYDHMSPRSRAARPDRARPADCHAAAGPAAPPAARCPVAL